MNKIGVNHGATVSDKVSIAINTHTNPRSEVVPPYFASFSNEWSISKYNRRKEEEGGRREGEAREGSSTMTCSFYFVVHYFSGSSAVNLFNLLKQWTGSAPYVRVGGNRYDYRSTNISK